LSCIAIFNDSYIYVLNSLELSEANEQMKNLINQYKEYETNETKPY